MTDVSIPENSEFRSAIKSAINRASAENTSGTPDHILADYLLMCLSTFETAVNSRASWRGESVELPALIDQAKEVNQDG